MEQKKMNSRKTSTFVSLTVLKLLTVCIRAHCGKLLEMGVSDHLTCLLRKVCVAQEATVRTLYGTMTGSGLRKECDKAVYCHPVYLTYMPSTS